MSRAALSPNPSQLFERASLAARNLAVILLVAPLPVVALLGCGPAMGGSACLGVAVLVGWCLGMTLPCEFCAGLTLLSSSLRTLCLRLRAIESAASPRDAIGRGLVQALQEQVQRCWKLSCAGSFAASVAMVLLLISSGVWLRPDAPGIALLALSTWALLALGACGPVLAHALGAAAHGTAELRLNLAAVERPGDGVRSQVPDPRTLGRLDRDFRLAGLLLAALAGLGLLGLMIVGIQLPRLLTSSSTIWWSFAGLLLPLLACWLLLVAALAWLLRHTGLALAALVHAGADLEAACRGSFVYREPFRSDRLRAAGQVLRILGFAGSLLAVAVWLYPFFAAQIPSDRVGILLAALLLSGGLLGGLVPFVLARWGVDFSQGLAALLRETERAVERREREQEEVA